eukprot:scaffold291306_cov30-Tisochrysis_lutea.AAC.1
MARLHIAPPSQDATAAAQAKRRQAIELAEQRASQIAAKGGKNKGVEMRRLTQEEILAEAAQTEIINREWPPASPRRVTMRVFGCRPHARKWITSSLLPVRGECGHLTICRISCNHILSPHRCDLLGAICLHTPVRIHTPHIFQSTCECTPPTRMAPHRQVLRWRRCCAWRRRSVR